MSTQTVRLAECASEIREACDRLLTIAPVASPEDVQAFCETIRLNAALMAGLGKNLTESSCVKSRAFEVHRALWKSDAESQTPKVRLLNQRLARGEFPPS